MNAFVQFIMNHGYLVLFAAVFARQIGLPLPTPLFLLAAGALAAGGKFRLVVAVTLSVTACVLADWVWYEAGRWRGDGALRFIHRFAPVPDGAEHWAKKTFARFGPALLVLDKFVPGLDAVMPPLAGAARTNRLRFLAFETLGAALWSSAYVGVGYIFSHDLDRAAAYAAKACTLLAIFVFAGFSIYASRKLVHWYRLTRGSEAVRFTPVDSIAAGCSLTDPCRIIAGGDHRDQGCSETASIASVDARTPSSYATSGYRRSACWIER